MDFVHAEFDSVSDGAWAIILVMNLFGALKCFVRYRVTSLRRYRTASIGSMMVAVGLGLLIFTELELPAFVVSIIGLVVVIASGVIRSHDSSANQ